MDISTFLIIKQDSHDSEKQVEVWLISLQAMNHYSPFLSMKYLQDAYPKQNIRIFRCFQQHISDRHFDYFWFFGRGKYIFQLMWFLVECIYDRTPACGMLLNWMDPVWGTWENSVQTQNNCVLLRGNLPLTILSDLYYLQFFPCQWHESFHASKYFPDKSPSIHSSLGPSTG